MSLPVTPGARVMPLIENLFIPLVGFAVRVAFAISTGAAAQSWHIRREGGGQCEESWALGANNFLGPFA